MSEDCDSVPFENEIETLTWKFSNGDYVQVEHNTTGYFISGRLNGKDWHDEDHEDFFCANTDEYLDFLSTHGLLEVLSVSAHTADRRSTN